ncbi:hypothetical protein LCGC14_1322820 [marine sediment metagenome]|uniref:Uncharacterized protein n=1 Tax=marine sediment metagenome TaxID=412755 RepID=A0A0F9NLC2_9ZZZZ
MRKKQYMFGIFLLGIIFLTMSLGNSVAFEEDPPIEDPPEEEPPHEEPPQEEPNDEDKDGVDDTVEEENKRFIEIWFGENVVEMASIKRHDEQKDILEMRIGYNQYGMSVRVSYGSIFRTVVQDPPAEEPPHEEPPDEEPLNFQNGGEHVEEWIEYRLEFKVRFTGLIEYVDLNSNGVFDREIDEFIEDYGINSFQPITYMLTPISDDSNLHYFLLNTTDGVFAAHIYFVEEFVYVDETLIAPTQVKIDIEISKFNYLDDNSQLALITKLRFEGEGLETDLTEDEKDGYANDEKEIFVQSDIYTGIFSWKETALIDGIEMDVLTSNLETDVEDEHVQILLLNYPRGNHIYHDPKIGISIGIPVNSIAPIIITGTIISIIGVAAIGGIVLKKRRII